jgi:hypothetical protein
MVKRRKPDVVWKGGDVVAPALAEKREGSGKSVPISLGIVKVYGGDDSLKILRREFVLDASYDHYLGEIVDKVIEFIGGKYPEGMPDDVRHVHTFDGGSIHSFTRGLGESYAIALWKEDQFQAALTPILLESKRLGTEPKTEERDVLFAPQRLTEWAIPEVA